MTRRGQCRCGAILQFRKTSQGYKTRCPDCSAVVRLRADNAARPPKQASSPALAAAGPPPLPPAALTDGPDLSVLSDAESSAPLALAEMEAYEPPASAARWWLLALVAGVVIVGVAAAATLLG